MSIQSANRLNGLAAQERARKVLGIEVKFRSQRGNEESWGVSPYVPDVRWECKSIKKLPALLKNAIQQVRNTRAVGSTWTEGVVLHDQETDELYAVVRLEPLVNVCRAVAEVGQGNRIKSLARDGEALMRAIREAAS